MLRLIAYEPENGTRIVQQLNEISDLVARSDCLVWLDGLDPTEDELRFIANEFRFHPLAIDDCRAHHERPKVDEYPGYYFIITHSVVCSEGAFEVATRELDMFLGRNYVVTLHREPLEALSRVAESFREGATSPEGGIGMLLYQILDGLVDSYFPILDAVDDQLDVLEDEVLDNPQRSSVQSMFKLKRALLLIRRSATPLRDVLNTLSRRDQPLLSEQDIAYLRDIYDHTLRIVDAIDTSRDILTGVLDAHLSVVSNQLNSVMKSLAAGAIILAANTVIAGIYGMNFRFMPEIYWRYGYPFALGLMGVASLGLFYYFRRIKWI